MIYVGGSGPAAVFCALALLKRGAAVTMLDAGKTLEPTPRSILSRLQTSSPENWTESDLKFLEGDINPTVAGLPIKLSYGSDFPYAKVEDFFQTSAIGASTARSFALGGLSNVWGAAMLPYKQHEIDTWPITATDLEPHYRAVLDSVEIAAIEDELTGHFPLLTTNRHALKRSSQAKLLLASIRRHRSHLDQQGLVFGQSRLAIRSKATGMNDCTYCGRCMLGCPYELIYHSGQTLPLLRSFPRFAYLNNIVVKKVSESGSRVEIEAEELGTRDRVSFQGERVFIGAGTTNTTHILLESLGMYDRPIRMLDSQFFIMPAFSVRGVPSVETENLFTLSQIFLEVMNPKISNRIAHMQYYTYNPLFRKVLLGMLGPLGGIVKWPLKMALGRLLIAQGFLHSEDSSKIRMTLRRSDGEYGRLEIEAELRSRPKEVVGAIGHQLLRNALKLGVVHIPPMTTLAVPGKSFHTGGTFPMTAAPQPITSNRLGIPFGMKRVHAVDSTIFPSIPGTTITFTSMANAHRIGTEVPL